eukprot:g15388.t1
MPRMSEAYLSRLGGVPGLDRLQAVEEEKQELLRRLEASGRRNQELELERQVILEDAETEASIFSFAP